VSFIDDIHSLPDSLRLVCQFAAMLMMFFQLGMFQPDLWWAVILALIVSVGATNIINFMDGINGMTAGYAFVALATLAYVDEHIVSFTDMRLIVIALLSVAVFAIFNFRKKAVCFAGDVGSVSMAFLLMFLIGTLMWTTGDFSWITLLVVYGVDGVLTILHRIMLKERITEAHRKHAYQLMANELHIPHTVVSVVYMVLQFIVNLCYLLHPGYLTLILAVVVLSIAYIVFMKKYFHLHQLQ
jgi:UDP-N-acetylmuramyl pentapeptide phosphotransferase/UDP-N-acetylglucosamine-1-phosphate transferase